MEDENLIDNNDSISSEELFDYKDENQKIDSRVEEVSSKRFIKNLAFVLFSNIFAILSGILVGFIIPKVLGIEEYGYYKTFSLYTNYIGLLHLGFIDGIYLKYAGKSKEELDKSQFRLFFRFLLFMQLIMSSIVFIIALFFIGSNYFLIFTFVSLDVLATNVITYYEFISQITLQFKRISIRNVIRNTLNIIAIIILFILYRYNGVTIYNVVYTAIVVGIQYVMALWYVISYRDLSFGKCNKLKDEKDNIIGLFKIGIQLLLANLIGQLLFVVDQQVVNIFFPNATYSTYAFAYTMINLITIATGAISVVLYPTLKIMNNDTVKKKYSNINAYLLMFVSLCLLIYFPLDLIIRNWLSQYVESLSIFYIILPGVLISSSIAVIKYNCYKTFNKVKSYFIKSLIMLIIAIIADIIVYFIFKNTMSISIVSIAVLITWYLIVEYYFIKEHKVKWIKNFIYMILMITSFYLVGLIPNIYLSGVSYLGAYLVLTLIFYFGLIKDLINTIFKRRR